MPPSNSRATFASQTAPIVTSGSQTVFSAPRPRNRSSVHHPGIFVKSVVHQQSITSHARHQLQSLRLSTPNRNRSPPINPASFDSPTLNILTVGQLPPLPPPPPLPPKSIQHLQYIAIPHRNIPKASDRNQQRAPREQTQHRAALARHPPHAPTAAQATATKSASKAKPGRKNKKTKNTMATDDQQINLPSLVVILVLSGLAIRYLFFSTSPSASSSSSSSGAARNRDPAALARSREQAVERILQIFPQVDRRAALWDLQRTGGNVAATTERILAGRLETVSIFFLIFGCCFFGP